MLVIPQAAQAISLEVPTQGKPIDLDTEVLADKLQNCFDSSSGMLDQILRNGASLLGAEFWRPVASSRGAHALPKVLRRATSMVADVSICGFYQCSDERATQVESAVDKKIAHDSAKRPHTTHQCENLSCSEYNPLLPFIERLDINAMLVAPRLQLLIPRTLALY